MPGGRKPAKKADTDAKHWAIFEEILERIRCGEDLGRICKAEKRFPHYTTVRAWIAQDKKYRDAFNEAKVLQADSEFEKSSWIFDKLLEKDIDPNTTRVALEIIKWRSSRLNPRKYHDQHLNDGDQKDTQVTIRIPELEALRKDK